MTLLLAINRYVAVCMPLQASHLCSEYKTKVQVVLVFVFSILFNTPRFFQHHLNRKTGYGTNKSVSLESTSIGSGSTFYTVYNEYLWSILVLLPLTLLVVLNTRLIVEIKRKKRERRDLTYNHGRRNAAKRQEGADNVTYSMFAIMVTAVCCHTPG